MSFEEYLLQKQYIQRTVNQYVKKINDFLSWTEEQNLVIQDIKYTDLLQYIRYKTLTGSGKRYVNQLLNIIRHYLTYQEREGNIPYNPAGQLVVRGVNRGIPHDLLTANELEDLFNHQQDKTLVDKRNKSILGLLVYQGVSLYELTQLETNHLKLREGKVYIPGSHKSNGRLLSLKPGQIFDLLEYEKEVRPKIIEISGKQSDKLFISTGNGKSLNNVIIKLLKKLQRQNSKIKNISQIRASVISLWIKQYNLRETQYMAGHKYVSSTEHYQADNLEDLQREVEKFHPLK